jgi:excisionase family DNA binding protein
LTEIAFSVIFSTMLGFLSRVSEDERMILADVVEQKKEALRVEDVARILDISVKQIYKMAAKGQIPSLRIANCVRFDPHDIAAWLRGQSRADPIATFSLPNRTHSKRQNRQLLNPVRRIDPHSPQLGPRQRTKTAA